jgi:hypothetical protein
VRCVSGHRVIGGRPEKYARHFPKHVVLQLIAANYTGGRKEPLVSKSGDFAPTITFREWVCRLLSGHDSHALSIAPTRRCQDTDSVP